MWKKDEMGPSTPSGSAQDERSSTRESARRSSPPAERATIGPSITIRGEVTGDEDLLIQGNVDGSVDLALQAVTVGREGRVKANITGRVVIVEGSVEGDLKAQEQVILRSSAHVQGDITAARVVLEDGASFRGLVDMGEAAKREDRSSSQGSAKDQGKASASSSSSGESSSGSNGSVKDAGKSTASSASSGKSTSGTSKEAATAADRASS